MRKKIPFTFKFSLEYNIRHGVYSFSLNWKEQSDIKSRANEAKKKCVEYTKKNNYPSIELWSGK